MTTTLTLLTKEQAYTPNFTDPRVVRKIESVIAWCSDNLSEAFATPVHSNVLTQVFGQYSSKNSRYLRYRLLIQEGSYIAGKQSLKYRLKPGAINALAHSADLMLVTSLTEADRLKARFATELESGVFKYRRSSDRDWHTLQSIPNNRRPGYTGPIKHEFWRDVGMPFNYDIVAAAPNILFQLAVKAGTPAVALSTIKEFLDDRKGFREHVASITGTSALNAKKIVTSLFNGARLAPHKDCGVYQMVDYDQDTLDRLKNDPEVIRLRGSIKIMWRRLTETFGPTLKAGGKSKFSLYFACERKVMDVVTSYLFERSVKHFVEHDGFRASREIDANELAAEVKDKTGFDLTFELSEK